MKISNVALLSALVAASAASAQSTHFAGGISKDPFSTSFPVIAGSYDLSFNNTSGAVTGTGTASTLSASVLKPATAPVYAITSVAIYSGPTQVASFSPGAATTVSLDSAGNPLKTRTKADYSFTYNTTLLGNTTYHFEFFQGATKVGSSATFTTPALTPVPEPETYAAAAALGLVGFGLWRRRNA